MTTNYHHQPQAAIYVCGTEADLAALTARIDQCKDYAEESNFAVPAEHIYQDTVSCFVPPRQRKQFTRLLEAASQHTFDLLLITDFDQISPESKFLEQTLAFLRQQNIEVVTVAWETREMSELSSDL